MGQAGRMWAAFERHCTDSATGQAGLRRHGALLLWLPNRQAGPPVLGPGHHLSGDSWILHVPASDPARLRFPGALLRDPVSGSWDVVAAAAGHQRRARCVAILQTCNSTDVCRLE